MNILTFGAGGVTSQLDRINQGFSSLGHQVNSKSPPDLIYANDIGSWDEAINTHSQFANSKCILTILDLPKHLPIDCAKQVEKVKQAAETFTICTISQAVQRDLLNIGVESHIIYQPVKDITDLGVKWEDRPIDYLIVGRNHDKGKGHMDITIPVVQSIHGDISKLFTVGEGFIGAQNYGVVTDDQLNVIYNNAKYVFVCGNFDGLGLSLLESCLAGAIPISYYHHPTAKEFINKELIFDSRDDIISFIKSGRIPEIDRSWYKKFEKIEIAKNILKVYEKISN